MNFKRLALIAFCVLLVVGYSYKAYQIFQPERSVILNVTVDDAYYYFQIAHHIALGQGSTFDGLTPTNGYHPLWMMLLVPLWYFFGTSLMLPVRLALLLALAFDVASTALLYVILRRVTSNTFIICATLFLWVFNPYNYFDTVTGLETPLAMFLGFLFLWQLIRTQERETERNYLLLGAAAGFMMLARTDYVFLAGAPFLLWAYERFDRAKLRLLARYLAVGAIIVLPWLLWNLHTFGTIVQTSGAASTAFVHQYVDYANPHYSPVLRFAKASFGELAAGIPRLFDQTGMHTLALLILGFLGGYVLARRGEMRTEKDPLLRSIAAFTSAIALYCLVAIGVRWTFRIWYFIPLANCIPVLWFAYGAEQARLLTPPALWQRFRILFISLASAAAALVVASFVYTWWQDFGSPRNGEGTVAQLAAVDWINATIPANETIGVFNAGMIGYFSAPRVVNLDGLVNNQAAAALDKGQLYSYVTDDLHLTHIVDFDRVIYLKYLPFWGVPDISSEVHVQKLIYGPVAGYDPVGIEAFTVGSR